MRLWLKVIIIDAILLAIIYIGLCQFHYPIRASIGG